MLILNRLFLRIRLAISALFATYVAWEDLYKGLKDDMTAWSRLPQNEKLLSVPEELVEQLKKVKSPKEAEPLMPEVNAYAFAKVQEVIYTLNDKIKERTFSSMFLNQEDYNLYLAAVEEFTNNLTASLFKILEHNIQMHVKFEEPKTEPVPKSSQPDVTLGSGFDWKKFDA